MDNITHSLVGVACADLVLPRASQARRRAIFAVTGILAANAPDLDLLYTWITPAPLGYLLHHRGHTHTIVGLLILALLLLAGLRRWPSLRILDRVERRALTIVVLLALASHLFLDAFNSYGVHPFYPFQSRWYYGDAIFIFEPWFWLLFGLAAALNSLGRPARVSGLLAASLLPLLLIALGLVPPSALPGFVIVGGLFVLSQRHLTTNRRAATAMGAGMLLLMAMLTLSAVARGQVRGILSSQLTGELVDIILTPSPASPLCWGVIAIEKNEPTKQFALWRGTLSLWPGWRLPGDCAIRRLQGASSERQIGAGFLLRDYTLQSLDQLRRLARDDCRARAWLRFGRAPVVQNDQLTDLRFSERLGPSFTTLTLSGQHQDCPAYVPGWEMPRRDLLDDR